MKSSFHMSSQLHLPWWAWTVVVVLLILIAWWSKGPQRHNAPLRWSLFSLRLTALFCAMGMLMGLRWSNETTFTEPDVVPILIDVSGSMRLMDNTCNRETQLKQAVHSLETAVNNDDRTTDNETGNGQPRQYTWHVFNDDVQSALRTVHGTLELPPLSGGPTHIGQAIDQVLAMSKHQPVAGLIVLSDGHGSLDGAHAALRKTGATVYVIPIGDLNPPPAVSLQQVIAPQSAFSEDRIPVHVTVRREDSGIEALSTVVRLVNEHGEEQDSTTLQVRSGSGATIVLSVIPELSGLAQWTIELEVDGQVLESVPCRVMVQDQPMRVLYVEGRPRFMHRFVAPWLTRESTIDVSILLQSADSEAAPDGNQPIRRLPSGQDEWDDFDLILLGDVDPRSFTEHQLDGLRDHVLNGAGLLWIPGSSIDSGAWTDTPLAGLLPVSSSAGTSIASGRLQRTLEGIELGLPSLPELPLEWAIVPLAIQPQARQLVELVQQDQNRSPVVVLLPTGQGHAGWIGTDDFWRWRRTSEAHGGNEFLLGMLRMLGRHSVPVEPLLQVQPDPVAGLTSVIVLDGVVQNEDITKRLVAEVLDHRGVPLQRVELHQDAVEGRWRGSWRPPMEGRRRLQLEVDGELVSTEVFVKAIDAEDVEPGVDVDALAGLIDEVGGSMVLPDLAHTVPAMIASQARRSSTVVDAGPALGWLLWSLLIAALGVEWSIRRWNALA